MTNKNDDVMDALVDTAILRIANNLLKFAHRIEAGELIDPGGAKALRLAAEAIINATGRTDK